MKGDPKTTVVEGLAEDCPEFIKLFHKSSKKLRKRLRKLAKRNDRNIRLLVRVEKALTDIGTVLKDTYAEIRHLNEYRPDDRFTEEHGINSWITKLSSGLMVSLVSVGTASALSFKITKELDADGFLIGLAIVMPFAFTGVVIKQIVSYGAASEWKVQIERIMFGLFLLILPLTFHEVAVHFLQIEQPVAAQYGFGEDTPLPQVDTIADKPLRRSFEGLYGGLLYVEYAVSYFGSALWQRSTDRRRNPKDTAIDVEIAPLKRKVTRFKKKLAKAEARKAVICNRLERDKATATAIKSILSKIKF